MKRLLLIPLLGLVYCAPLRASISLTQSRAGSSTGTNTVTLAFNSNVASGNLLVVDVDWGGAGVQADYTFSDTIGNAWTKHTNGPLREGTGNEIHMGWTVTGSAGADSVTVTVANNGNHTLRIQIHEYNSTTAWPATPFDVGTSQTNASSVTTGNPGNITPAAAGELVHAAIQWTSAVNTITVTSPYIEQRNGGTNGWISDGKADSCDNQNASSGSQTCTFNWSTSTAYSAIIAAFKTAGFAPTFTSEREGTCGGTPTSCDTSSSMNVAADDLIICYVGAGPGSGAPTSVEATTGAANTLTVSSTAALTGTTGNLYVGYKLNASANATAIWRVTYAAATAFQTIQCGNYAPNATVTWALDQGPVCNVSACNATSTGTSRTTVDTGTTTQATEVGSCASYEDSNNTYTVANGFSLRGAPPLDHSFLDKMLSSTGVFPNGNFLTSNISTSAYVALCATFKAAGGGGGGGACNSIALLGVGCR